MKEKTHRTLYASLAAIAFIVPTLMAWGGSAQGSEHAVLVVSFDSGDYSVVSAFRAPGPVPKAPRRLQGYPLRVAVVSQAGKVLFETGLRDPAVIRGEFASPGGDGNIEGHHFTRTSYSFVMRVPIHEGARIDLFVLDPELRRVVEPPLTAFRKAASFSPAALAEVLP